MVVSRPLAGLFALVAGIGGFFIIVASSFGGRCLQQSGSRQFRSQSGTFFFLVGGSLGWRNGFGSGGGCVVEELLLWNGKCSWFLHVVVVIVIIVKDKFGQVFQ